MRQGFSRLLLVVSLLTLPLSLLGGEVNVELMDVTVTESDSVMLCALLTGDGGPLSSLNVSYSLMSDTAIYGMDYNSTSGESGYLDVVGEKLCITVDTFADGMADDNEIFSFVLTDISPMNNSIGTNDTTTVTIVELTVSFNSPTVSVSEDQGPLSLCANIGGILPSSGITVDITVTPGTAQTGDYVVPQQFIMFPPDPTSCLVITIIDEILYEDNETFVVEMSSVSSPAQISSPASVTVTILNDDPVPQVTVVPGTMVSDDVGASINLCIQSDSSAGKEITVDYTIEDGTAIEGEDFTLNEPATGTITIPIGATMECLTGAVTYMVDNNLYETDQSYTFQISGPGVADDGTMTTNYVILDSTVIPELTFAQMSYSFTEDLVYMVTVTTGSVVVQDPAIVTSILTTLDISAESNDYLVPSNVSVANGNSSSFYIVITGDNFYEGDEVFTLSTSTNSVNITIVDDEPYPNIIDIKVSQQLDESVSSNVTLQAEIEPISEGDLPLIITIQDGTAMLNEDFTFTPAADLYPGMTSTSSLGEIMVINDEYYEGMESFSIAVVLGDNPAETFEFDIMDNEAPPVVSVDAPMIIVKSVTLMQDLCARTNVLSEPVITVNYSVTGNEEDYTIENGQNGTIVIESMNYVGCTTLSLIDDDLFEGNETIDFTLLSASPGSLGSQTTANIRIVDNEDLPTLTIQSPSSVDESVGSFEVCVNANISSELPISVLYEVRDLSTTAMEDYTVSGGSSGNLQFEPLGKRECLTITVTDDTVYEGNEQFVFNLSNPINARLIGSSSVTITIQDNDPSPSPTPPVTSSDNFLFIIIGAVAGAVVAALLFLLLIILVIVCCRVKVNRQGFYITDEDKGEAPQMLRYSASLRSISSQTVVPVDNRAKENEYMV